jgi:hypothetical protein
MAFVKECKQSSKKVLDVNFDHMLNQGAFDTSKDLQDVFSECYQQFFPERLQDFRLCHLEMTKEELDLIILSQIRAGTGHHFLVSILKSWLG